MNIEVIETITIATKRTQISFLILESGHVALGYFGNKMATKNLGYVVEEIERASYMADTDAIKDFKLEQLPLVYPAFGNPDMRNPAHYEVYENGSRLCDFRYREHSFNERKPPLAGLPYAHCENNITVLTIIFEDVLTKNQIALSITSFEEYDVFTQSVEYRNRSEEIVSLEQFMSLNLDFLSDKFELITLNGAWGRENQIIQRKLVQGIQGVHSNRGASGHGQNPFIALVEPTATENQGVVIAANLIYSGNFSATAEVDMHQNTRLQIGINPFGISWELGPNSNFGSPEAAFLYTDSGLNDMSQKYHRFYQECLVRSLHANKVRPILINNWEATYFDFDKNILYALADEAKQIGIELFVLDDGWFGQREDATSSLGDWLPNEAKLGGTLTDLIEGINEKGLQFGLWVEPEMISPKSELFRLHPDWAIQVPERCPQSIRHQYVLDLTRKEIQDFLIQTLDSLLSNYSIDYLKWDMNRNITDIYSLSLPAKKQNEFSHRYILGLYRILEVISQKHQQVLFESCAGGGGRFDAGMLYYMPQTWTSDDTDAIARLAIQKGTSLVYPPISMGCHVSAVPNHQIGRITSIKTRGVVAQQGNFGYELNLLKLSEEEKENLKIQISQYKEVRETLQMGTHFRLDVYNDENEVAWMKQNQQTGEVIISHINILAKPNTIPKRLKPLNLDKTARYSVDGNAIRLGSELMEIGLTVPKPNGDFHAIQWVLKKMEET